MLVLEIRWFYLILVGIFLKKLADVLCLDDFYSEYRLNTSNFLIIKSDSGLFST